MTGSLNDQLAKAKAQLGGAASDDPRATALATGASAAGSTTVVEDTGVGTGTATAVETYTPGKDTLAPLVATASADTKKPLAVPASSVVLEDYEAPAGSFKSIKLTALITKKGKRILPNQYGYFVDLTEEQKAEMAYFVGIGAVEEVKG